MNNVQKVRLAQEDFEVDFKKIKPISLSKIKKNNKLKKNNHPLVFVHPKDNFNIKNWTNKNYFDKSLLGLQPPDFLKGVCLEHFKVHPNTVILCPVDIFKVIDYLNSFGEVVGIFSEYFIDNKLGKMLLLIKNSQGSESFVFFDDIRYYKKGVKNVRYAHNNECITGVIATGVVSLHFKPEDSWPYDLATEINSKYKTKYEDEESNIDMIIATQQGLALRNVPLDSPKHIDLELHYGEGFNSFHENLISRLESKNKGIVMFHGPPGTGKTHYIRSIIPSLVDMDKRIVLVPKHVLGSLESPQFNTFMIENFTDEKIVFIIEDAESIISKRDSAGGYRSELVSTLLNITDGILNDIFNIQVILTFNTAISTIDEALLRKGRLIAKYEFENLPRAKALKLANSLGIELRGNEKEYSLADIYSAAEAEEDDILINQNIKKEKTFVGF